MMMHDATPAKRNTLTSQRCVPGLALLPVLGHRSVQERLKRMEGGVFKSTNYHHHRKHDYEAESVAPAIFDCIEHPF